MSEKNPIESSENAPTKVDILKDGPMLVQGAVEIKLADGQTETKTQTTAFCRCGASVNKPYCDGAHRKINFKG